MKMLMVMLALLSSASFGFAAEYDLQIEQQGAELFKITNQDVYIWTQYCFVDVGTTEVHLNLEDGRGEIKFIDTQTRCDVQGVYGKSPLEGGDYTLVLTRADDNWYSIDDKQAAVLTVDCLASAESLETKVIMTDDGGTAFFPDEECSVLGVYTPVVENQEVEND
jgi:hypothetical protein